MLSRVVKLILVISCVVLVQAVTPADARVAADAKCKASKARAAGKKAADILKAFGKNKKKPNISKLTQDVSKAQSKFTKAFAKAESTGGCETTNDAPAIEAKVDAFAADVVDDLSDDITVANINILHGLFCATGCRLEDRIELLFQWIAASGCPDVVTLQEVIDAPTISTIPFLEAQHETVCPFPYEIFYPRSTGVDDELILTRYPVIESEVRSLHGGFRRVLFARIDHPIGPVDVFTTHLASGSDGGPDDCGPVCPDECLIPGVVTNRDCQAVQMALFIEEKHDVAPPAVITGDFNAPPGSFVYNQFVGRGWTDTYLAVGNPECNPPTGVGCTSGRSSTLAEIESTAANVDERIDYTFLIPPGPGSSCAAVLDSALDDDGDGTATRIFADEPNPFAPACGPAPDPVCWPSDHEGTEIDLNCQ
jgi:endonuclease/exonuclease/phosphatase family metal-dependent hydrolase